MNCEFPLLIMWANMVEWLLRFTLGIIDSIPFFIPFPMSKPII